ncbi:sorting nexin-7 [Syngnathus scovelli]|uniref:sorting nexin-7 n=1 Tax=Syngnathus scovelli TaxID=161590 RepID=UPI00210FF1E4|nr:sorting nexin-7 [Syngnathus scovelli]
MTNQTNSVVLSKDMLDLEEDEDLEVFSKKIILTDEDPAPNSPSSMVNQYQLDEDEQQSDSTKDLFVTVDSPESHVTAIETFIMYRVITKTTRSEFDSCEYEVLRRYQDFVWLRSKLEETHPTLIVPPLPEKFVMKGMVERFNDDFIETRKKALHRFLNKIAGHPILSFNQHFKLFLTAQDLSTHKKQGPGFLSRMGDTVRSVASSVWGIKSRPEEFTLMQEYVENFGCKISSVDKVTQRIIKEQREYLDELKQYGPLYSQWAEVEEDLHDPLQRVANCMDHCSKETEKQIHQLSDVMVPAFHEYVLCTEVIKNVMKRRDNIQAYFETKNEALASKKADQDVGHLEKEVEALADRMETANNALKGDWVNWQNSMRADLKSAFISTAEKNVECYEKCLAVWESFLLSQRRDPVELQDEDTLN